MADQANRLSPLWAKMEMAASIVEYLVKTTHRRYAAPVSVESLRQHLSMDQRFRSRAHEIQPVLVNLMEYGGVARQYNPQESVQPQIRFWATEQANPGSQSEWAKVGSFPEVRSRTSYTDLYAQYKNIDSPGLLRVRVMLGEAPEVVKPPEVSQTHEASAPTPDPAPAPAPSREQRSSSTEKQPRIFNLRPGIPLDVSPLADIGQRVSSAVARTVRDNIIEKFLALNPGVSVDTAALQAEAFGCRPFLARRSIQDLVNTRRVNLDGAFLWPVDKHESSAASATKTYDLENTRVSPPKEDQEGGEHDHGQEDGSPSGQADSSPVGDPRIDIVTSGGDPLQKESLLLADRISRLPLNERSVVLMIIAR